MAALNSGLDSPNPAINDRHDGQSFLNGGCANAVKTLISTVVMVQSTKNPIN